MIKNTLFILFLSTALMLPVNGHADQLDPGLSQRFLRMQSTRDASVAAQMENQIWQIWTISNNPEFNRLMQLGIGQMNNNSLFEALDTFDNLIELAPNFAEAWNKRATIYYLLQNYADSEADIEQTLLLEPKHFGALSGLGLIYLSQGEYVLAREAFNSALEINPSMVGVQQNLEALENYFNERAI